MLHAVEFDQTFFQRPCYRLRPTVTDAEWSEFDRLAREISIFADLKSPASDLETASDALTRSFRKICTQVELSHHLTKVDSADRVVVTDSLALANDEHRAHAEHFLTSRFRQDPHIPSEVANNLYAAWIANSLGGRKRIASLGVNFCSFDDKDGVRHIDLLSVLDKGRGYATELLRAVASDAKSSGLRKILVTTEVENEPAMKAYRAAGFEIESFNSVFHFKN